MSIPPGRVCGSFFPEQEKPAFSSQRTAGSTFHLNGLRTAAVQVAVENILLLLEEYQ